ncbi:AbiV family abortive infection protein [Amphiplicatus metriothermophilus]|uniref:Abortive infection protein, AbiV family n=1 Tax=Amphiplicatus metriothermophilus TaxID=1519374 RepID=A0A239PJV3_9PROT|nr:AbiV family abortive infection protein [Amphiplicatus metriothermophilus]MBB5517580.1 AbiV family abortive infection protein [Amphiplicatus metriothermophilus]SNT68086.1 abortive infection protein, AbiV family [Amphiplicatus metriothermophilus]
MPRKKHHVTFSNEMLTACQSAAMENAESLYKEAELLLEKKYYARAYFLAVASIEETGKAALAFNALGRKLNDSSVQSRLNVEFQDHHVKIQVAVIALYKALCPAELRGELQSIAHLQASLIHGREPSMYVGFNEAGELHVPNGVVSCTAAADCVRLAKDCHSQTKKMLKNDKPYAFSDSQDRLFALGKKASKVWKEPDFHKYLLVVIENKNLNPDMLTTEIPAAIVDYYQRYFCKGRKFEDRL